MRFVSKVVLASALAGCSMYKKPIAAQATPVHYHIEHDVFVVTKSDERLPGWKVINFVSNKTTPKSRRSLIVDTGMCTLRMNTADYRWVACFRDNGEFKFDDARRINVPVLQIVKSYYPRCQRCTLEEARKWHGGCKIGR